MSDEAPQLKVHISGVVIPSWLAVCLLLTAIFSALSLLNQWQRDVAQKRELTIELRIINQRINDVENVLIRNSIATREDFMTPPVLPSISIAPSGTKKGQ